MNQANQQSNSNPSVPHNTIEAVPFAPSELRERRFRLSVWHVLLAAVNLIVLLVFWFLFTSKSVQIDFKPSADQVNITGGLSFELGGVYLLREGNYTVTAEVELYEPLVGNIEVGTERNQKKELVFIPKPGFLNFTLQPDDALLQLDGVTIEGAGGNSQSPLEVPAGEHELGVSHPRYLPHQSIIQVQGLLKQQQHQVTLDPNWANVVVESAPEGAQVYIDDQLWPERTPVTIEALSGEREIRVSLPGYKSHRERIFAQASARMMLDPIRLVQADAQLRVSSSPDGAAVILAGQFVGRTPITLDLKSATNHAVRMLHNGYASHERNFRLDQQETRDWHANLQRLQGEVVVIAEPSSANLVIDGRARGTANQTLKLPVQEHDFAISLEGYATYTQTVTPRSGLTQQIKVRLLTHEEARLRALKPSITAPGGETLLLFEPFDFQMGASRREPGRRANESIRDTRMERLFYLATHEVTNAAFRQFASGHDSGKYVNTILNEDDLPAANLSWHDAAAYCNWLSDQEGLPKFYTMEFSKVVDANPQATGYRLPTEAEWAWAARTQTADSPLLRFPWGSNLPPQDRHGNYADRAGRPLMGRVIFGYNDNYAAAAPVGTFRANGRQLHDMGGNVAEWTHDFYALSGVADQLDPLGPASGEYHVIKGSSWMHATITELRLSFRDYGIDARPDVGFRIARYAE